jgi:DNA-directed RNA polymerase specialized sigma24 family protein
MTEISFSAVDFEEVLGRLTLHAQNLAAALVCVGLDERALKGGDSAGDLAQSTLLKLLDPQDTTVRWSAERGQPTTAGVVAYLRKVLDRDFLDLKKSSLYKTTVYPDSEGVADEEDEDGEGGITLDQMAVVFDTPEGVTLRRERAEWILGQFDGETELKEIAELQLDPLGYNAFSNQELAQLLGTTVKDIENRKKRVKRVLKKLAASGKAAGADDV